MSEPGVLNLKVIIASTRPGRGGKAVGDWFYSIAESHAAFYTELLDLAELNLPFLDEPEHPRLQRYTLPHTKAWSETIAAGDAFIFIMPEYNYGYPAPLKNALDMLSVEWANKPCSFVSYGGIAGGTRAVQQLKQVVQAFPMIPLPEAVVLPFYSQQLSDGVFTATDSQIRTAEGTLDALAEWAELLKARRESLSSSA